MSGHFLVCPFEPHLLTQMSGRAVVPCIRSLDEIPAVTRAVDEAGAHLHCLLVRADVPLESLSFKEEWKDIPLAVFAPGMGRLSGLIAQFPILRTLNVRIYLPGDGEDTFTALRILSSLGIETALVLETGEVDWERVADLMSYALFPQVPHAPIAPFEYLLTRYHPHQRNDFGAVYFDDPRTYLHVDRSGRVALSQRDLEQERFIVDGVGETERIEGHPRYRERLNGWTQFFLEPNECASCTGWRICVGRFAGGSSEGKACKEFFSEFIDALEQARAIRTNGAATWQP